MHTKNNYYIALIIIIVFCLSLGVTGETYFPGNNYFARSGALIVIMGVLLGLVNINKLPMSFYTKKDCIKNLGDTLHDKKRTTNDVIFNRAYLESLYDQNVLRDRLLKFEAAILITGTFIWGFGDLIWCYYLKT